MGDGMHGVGFGTTQEVQPTEYKVFADVGFTFPVMLSSASRDDFGSPAHSPSTTIRRGIVLGRVTASKEFIDYDASITPATGQEVAICFLDEEVNLLNEVSGAAEDKLATAHLGGVYEGTTATSPNIDAGALTDIRGKFGSGFKADIYG